MIHRNTQQLISNDVSICDTGSLRHLLKVLRTHQCFVFCSFFRFLFKRTHPNSKLCLLIVNHHHSLFTSNILLVYNKTSSHHTYCAKLHYCHQSLPLTHIRRLPLMASHTHRMHLNYLVVHKTRELYEYITVRVSGET